jgi:ribosomal protein S27E
VTTLHPSLSTSLLAYAEYADRPFVDVRCRNCGKLICRWRYAGVSELDVKCIRCGRKDSILLSTN